MLRSLSSNPPKSLAMVCVDSVISLYRAASNRSSTTEDSASSSSIGNGTTKTFLRDTMEVLASLSKKGVRVCIVNEATADFANPAHNSFKPVGGNRITKYLTCRLRLKKPPRASASRKVSRLGSDGKVISEDEFEIRREGICGVGDA